MLYVVQSGNADVIERMWRVMVSARKNSDLPEIWRLTDEILDSIQQFYRLGQQIPPNVAPDAPLEVSCTPVIRFLDIPVDPTTTMPHLLCHPNVVYHL